MVPIEGHWSEGCFEAAHACASPHARDGQMNLESDASVSSHTDTTASILVADDDEGIRSMLSCLLSRSGYKVILAKDGEQALQLFLKNSVSLVMTDFSMPGMDGLTLATMVKTASPKTPVIMITGSQIQGTAGQGSVDYFLFKPFQLDEVQKTVEFALTGVPFVSGTEHGAEIQPQG